VVVAVVILIILPPAYLAELVVVVVADRAVRKILQGSMAHLILAEEGVAWATVLQQVSLVQEDRAESLLDIQLQAILCYCPEH
jgi:hypothetical protein